MKTLIPLIDFDKKTISTTSVNYISDGVILNKKPFTFKGLGAISHLKKWVKENEKSLKLFENTENEELTGLRFATELKKRENFVMFDIKNCFPNIAIKNHLIPDYFFDTLNELPKNERLAVLGSISGTKTIEYFNENGEVKKIEDKKCINKNYFFTLLKHLEILNLNLKKEFEKLNIKMFAFYFDAAFIQIDNYLKNRIEIKNLLNSTGYDYVFKDVLKLRKTKKIDNLNKLHYFFSLDKYEKEKKTEKSFIFANKI